MIELLVFIVSSLGIIYLSRHAFRKLYTHGFPRFIAFEALLGLIVVNAHRWFVMPFSLPQVISWILLICSALLAIDAIRVLRMRGAPDSEIQDTSRLAFEKTTRLVQEGPYRLIRHPMYASLLGLTWGVFLKQINLLSVLLTLVVSLTLFLTAAYEERENLGIFGEAYATYMQHTKRFIPFLF